MLPSKVFEVRTVIKRLQYFHNEATMFIFDLRGSSLDIKQLDNKCLDRMMCCKYEILLYVMLFVCVVVLFCLS